MKNMLKYLIIVVFPLSLYPDDELSRSFFSSKLNSLLIVEDDSLLSFTGSKKRESNTLISLAARQ